MFCKFVRLNGSVFRSVFIAATDSAVPCAMLLDLARTLKPLLERSSFKVIFILFQ